MSKWRKILLTVITVLIIIPVALSIAIQLPIVQTSLVKKAGSIVSKKIDGDISIGRVYLSLPNRLIIKDIHVSQANPQDTVLHLDKFLVHVSVPSLIQGNIHIKRVLLEGGKFNLYEVDSLTTNLQKMLKPLSSKEKQEKAEADSSAAKPDIRADRVQLRNFAFSFHDKWPKKKVQFKSKKAIDYDNIDLYDMNLDIRNLKYKDSLLLTINNLSTRELKGFHIKTFSGDLSLTDHWIHINNLRYNDEYSDLYADEFALIYESFKDFGKFTKKVAFDAKFNHTLLDFRTLEYYGDVTDITLKLDITGHVTGPVKNLRSKHLTVRSADKTKIDLSFWLSGLPRFRESIIDVKIDNLTTNSSDIAEIISQVSASANKKKIKSIAEGQTIRFNGSMVGMYDDLMAHGQLNTESLGSAELNLVVESPEKKHYQIAGHVGSYELDLGGILNSKSIGKLSCQIAMLADLNKGKRKIEIDSLTISRLGLLGYDYGNMSVDGVLTNEDFKGSIVSRDPNLDFDFSGEVAFRNRTDDREDDKYKFILNINKANLDEINLEKRDSWLELHLNSDFTISRKGELFGNAHIGTFKTRVENETYDIGEAVLRAYLSEGRYLMRFNSSFAEMRYRGSAFLGDFISSVTNLAGRRTMPNLLGKDDGKGLGNDYSFSIKTGDMRPLCQFFAPELYISNGTQIDLGVSKLNQIECKLKSNFISLGKKYIKDIDTDIHSVADTLQLKLKTSMMEFGKFIMENDSLSVNLNDNMASIDFGFGNINDNGSPITRARLQADVTVPGSGTNNPYKAIVDIKSSNIDLKQHNWMIMPSSISIAKGMIDIDRFTLANGNQSIAVDGRISDNILDTLSARIQNLDLSVVDVFAPFGLKGTLDGSGEAMGIRGHNPGAIMDFKAEHLAIKDEEVGSMTVKSLWNSVSEQFDVQVKNTTASGKQALIAEGYIKPDKRSLQVKASMDSFRVGLVEPLLTGIVSDLEGTMSGDFDISGSFDKLSVNTSNARLNNLACKVDYTQVPYILDGSFTMNDKGLRFTDMAVKDTFGNQGTVGGGISYENFKNIRLNIRFRLKEMHALNTGSQDNSSFYGKAFASGTVGITGPMDKIHLGINITTDPQSQVHIKLGSSGKEHQALLTFIGNEEKLNEYDSLRTVNAQNRVKVKKSSLDVGVNVTATPDAELVIDLGSTISDGIKARGSGLAAMTVDSENNFLIKGDYTIQEGEFRLNLMDITSKNFLIRNGSSLGFVGDIMQTNLDLTATYRTKASLNTLLGDSKSSGRRTVDCGIGINGKLSNPEIGFDITIPDLDPSTLSRVESTLNTEDKRMKQVLALLVSGAFVPDSESGIVNNTSILYSNATEIMANQFNNIFRQLDIPIDLGFSYQPGAEGKMEGNMFDVAISTQIFNNRVTINGNLGNRRNISSSKNDFVGDIDVEVKINKSGKFRGTIFSHSADQYSNVLDQSQRTGVGLSIQEDFDNFQELIRSLFWSKARKEKYEQEQARKRMENMRRQRPDNERRQRPRNEQTLPDTDSTGRL